MPRRTSTALALTAVVLTAAACGDDPFQINWDLSPAQVLLYSLARPELNLPSAFNLNQRRTVEVESPGATGGWDFAVDTRNGELVFITPGVLGLDSRAGIATRPDETFEDIREAPADSAAYVTDEPVVIQVGTLYVVRTDESPGAFGARCVYYGKMRALNLDTVTSTVQLEYDSNPVCNDRALVPPED